MAAKRLPEKRDHCNPGATSFFGLESRPPTPSGSPRTGSHSHFHQASGLPPDCNGLQPGEIDVFSLYLPPTFFDFSLKDLSRFLGQTLSFEELH
jgi:hypothetical protein